MEQNVKLQLPEEAKGKKVRIRKLTPRECFRLMAVSDSDFDKIKAYKWDGKSGDLLDCNGKPILDVEAKNPKVWKMKEGESISDSQLYKLAGNSIVVDVMTYMFENLLINKNYIEKNVQVSTSMTKEPTYVVEDDGQISFF